MSDSVSKVGGPRSLGMYRYGTSVRLYRRSPKSSPKDSKRFRELWRLTRNGTSIHKVKDNLHYICGESHVRGEPRLQSLARVIFRFRLLHHINIQHVVRKRFNPKPGEKLFYQIDNCTFRYSSRFYVHEERYSYSEHRVCMTIETSYKPSPVRQNKTCKMKRLDERKLKKMCKRPRPKQKAVCEGYKQIKFCSSLSLDSIWLGGVLCPPILL